MLSEKKLVKFDCEHYCLLKFIDDYTGHTTFTVRKVPRSGIVRTPEGLMDVKHDLMELDAHEADIEKWRKWYAETKF